MPEIAAQGVRMRPKTRASEAGEFCLVLTPTWGASVRASGAIMERFTTLAEEVRRDLATRVAELVSEAVARRPSRPITVAVARGSNSIRGEIVGQGDAVEFEIPLAR
jgi:hypothetical protein